MEIPTLLPMYIPSRKSVRKPKEGKFSTYMPLLPKKVPFEEEVLGKIP